MEIPVGNPDGAGISINYNEITSNKFEVSSYELISYYWTYSNGQNNGLINDASKLSAYVTATLPSFSFTAETTTSESGNWQIAFSSVSGFFNNGYLNSQINHVVRNGTENAFDGYTTVYYYRGGIYDLPDTQYIDSMSRYNNGSTYFNGLNGNIFNTGTYNWSQAKYFKKNIMKHKNGNFYTNSTASISFDNSVVPSFPSRQPAQFAGEYGYQTVTSNRTSLTAGNTIEEAFGFTLPIQFKKCGASYGYCFSATQDEKETSNYINLTLGEYVTPRIIYSALNDGTRTSYTTTAVSSQNGFGGILVVDSSGRNVMFLDNDNGLDLTGNVISYPTFNIQENKYILEIE